MFLVKRILSVSIPVIAVGSFAAASHAATESFSATIPLQSTTYTQSFTLGAFDPSLGTLTGVTLTTEVEQNTIYSVYDTSSTNSYTFQNGQATVPVTVTGPDGSMYSYSGTLTNTVSGTAGPGNNNFPGQTGDTTTTDTVSSANFASYEGTSGTSKTFSAAFSNAAATGSSSTAPAFTLYYSASGTAGGMVTVNYTYTPTAGATPEPSALALLIPGVLGMVGVGVRRRRNAA